MQMTPVRSSMIAAVGYDPDTQQLQVEFSNGSVWQYDDVDPADAEGLKSSASAGAFFHGNIRNSYSGTQVS